MIRVGVPTGPYAKGPTIPPILSDVGSILPKVKSTSLTRIPGDARFSGILFSLAVQIYSRNIYDIIIFTRIFLSHSSTELEQLL